MKAALVESGAMSPGWKLELRQEEAGLRYYLEGAPIANGDPIEVLLSRGRWVEGYFQWSGVEARWPGLRVPLGGPWEAAFDDSGDLPMAVVALPPRSVVRRSR